MVVNNRIWIVGAVIVMIAVVLLGWFLGAAPRVAEATANELQRQAAVAQNETYTTTLATLKKDYENIDELRDELQELQEQIPSSARLSRFIGSLRELEGASGVVLSKFASADPTPFVYLESVPVPVAPTTEPEGEGDAATETPTAEVPVGPGPKLVQTLSPNEFIAIQIDLEVTGTQPQIFAFVDALQNAKRRFLVTSFSIITNETAPGTYTGKIGGTVYVLIDPTKPVGAEEEDGEEVPVEPTASPTPTDAPSSSPSPSGSPTP